MGLETREDFIQASPPLVFAYISDVRRHIEWSGAVEHGLERIEVLTDGPVGFGTRWRSDGRNLTGKLNHDESVVTEFDPPRRFGFDTQFELSGARVTFAHRYDLTPENGGTRLSYTLVRATPRNLRALLLLLSFLTVRRLTARRVVSSGFASLKAAVERLAAEQAPA
jgi:uncharacterized protein YndB with AHSA1/START domain